MLVYTITHCFPETSLAGVSFVSKNRRGDFGPKVFFGENVKQTWEIEVIIKTFFWVLKYFLICKILTYEVLGVKSEKLHFK